MDGLNLDAVVCNPDKSIETTNESCRQDLLIVEESSIPNLDNLWEEDFLSDSESRNVYHAESKQGDLLCENSCNKVPSQLPGSFQTDNVCIEAFTPVEEMVTNAIPLHDNNIVNGDCFTLTEIVPGHDSAHIVEDFVSDKMGLLSNDFQAKNAICYKSSESAPDIDDDNDSATFKFPIQANMGPDCKCLSGDISDIDRSSHENEQVAIDNKDKLAFEDQNGFGEMLLNSPCDFSDIYSNDTEHGNPIESLQIPFFDHIDYESDHIAEEEFPIDNLNSISQIPNFELLQLEAHETANCSGYEDLNVIELLKEVKYDLTRRFRNDESDDLGVTALFDEPQTSVNNSCTGAKSKSARKRKKQLLKLRKPPVASPASENVKRKFAQSFQELQSARLEFHDYNIDSKYTCPVCLEMYHMPSICNPCSHMFCDPCLRRMTSQGYEGIPCPLCRTVISSCQLDKEFDDMLVMKYPEIYTARAMLERNTKFRHYRLPYTAPVPLRKRLMRQLIASRNIQSDTTWMSHDWFKFLLGCTVGMCISLLIMLFNRVKSVRDARDVNIVFLSILIGMSVTFLIFKHIKI